MNGMMYIRGSRKDFDDWAASGNNGWSYNEILPYFLKSEDNKQMDLIDRGFHSTGGLLSVSQFPYHPPLSRAILKAGEELGYLPKQKTNQTLSKRRYFFRLRSARLERLLPFRFLDRADDQQKRFAIEHGQSVSETVQASTQPANLAQHHRREGTDKHHHQNGVRSGDHQRRPQTDRLRQQRSDCVGR